MNTKSVRREILIGIGGFAAGAAIWLPIANWHPVGSGLEVQSIGPGRNHIAVITTLPTLTLAPSRVERMSFEDEFGLLRQPTQQEVRREDRPSGYGKRVLFDMPRQQPWVAPYEVLIQQGQKH